MNKPFPQAMIKVRRFLWSFIVAYMIGLHNFWMGEHKTVDAIKRKVEVREVQGNSKPKN